MRSDAVGNRRAARQTCTAQDSPGQRQTLQPCGAMIAGLGGASYVVYLQRAVVSPRRGPTELAKVLLEQWPMTKCKFESDR